MEVVVTRKGYIRMIKEKRFALLIANGEYEDAKLTPLKAPKQDVEKLRQVLINPDIGGFEEVKTIIDASANTLRKAIAQFFEDKQRIDVLVVYFSGHGVIDSDRTLYLPTKDTELRYLSATGLEAEYITREMDKRGLKRVVLILDCCYAGALKRPSKSTALPNLGTTFNSGYGRIVLTASSAVEEAATGDLIEDKAEYSLFTSYLVEGLETGKAGGNEEWITVDDLYTYAYTQVIHAPKPHPQTPQKWADQQEGLPIVIAKNTGFKQSRTQPADRIYTGPVQLPQNMEALETIVSNQKIMESWLELQNLLDEITFEIDQIIRYNRFGKEDMQHIVYIWRSIRENFDQLAVVRISLQSLGPAHRADGSEISAPEWDTHVDALIHWIDECMQSGEWRRVQELFSELHNLCERFKLRIRSMVKEVMRESTSTSSAMFSVIE